MATRKLSPGALLLGTRSFSTRTGEQSYAFLGRKYEEACQAMLRDIGVDARLVGGASDGGIDLCGQWHLDDRDPVPIVAQCKNTSRRPCPPVFVRELEGAVSRMKTTTVAMLICSSDAGKAAVEAIRLSSTPILFLLFDTVRLKRAFSNAALQRQVPRLRIASRHTPHGVEPVFFYSEA